MCVVIHRIKHDKFIHSVALLCLKGIWPIKASATILSHRESCLHLKTFYISNKCANWYRMLLPLAMVSLKVTGSIFVTQVLREA